MHGDIRIPEHEYKQRAENAAAILRRENLDDSDFAYIDSQGGRHLPMHDAAHARNALARFDQTEFESEEAKRKARRKLIARCKELGVEVSEESQKSAKMGKPQMRQMMMAMASEMGMEMTEDEMGQMMADLDSEMPEAEMRATMQEKMQARKRMIAEQKSVSLKAVSYEDIRREVGAIIDRRIAMVGPLELSRYAYVEATYPDHVIACIHSSESPRYYRIPYMLGEDGHVASIGEAEEVEQTYVPTENKALDSLPITDHAILTANYAASLTQRTKDLRERRIKEGRVISTINRKRLAECLASMRTAADELQALLDSTEPQPAKAASVWRQLQARNIEAFASQIAATG